MNPRRTINHKVFVLVDPADRITQVLQENSLRIAVECLNYWRPGPNDPSVSDMRAIGCLEVDGKHYFGGDATPVFYVRRCQ